ncbi:MAG: hypothetical protein JNJ60_00320 [Rhodocyclaceae bacterium]|nr:hypothetical protein [Rhodocyclaceae bacterium]
MAQRILHGVSNVAHHAGSSEPTGLRRSEPAHAWDVFAAPGWTERIVRHHGGTTPLEPRSRNWPHVDAGARACLADPAHTHLLLG